ncbi:MAG: chloride channel protein [Pseudomonadales bacterium]|nr:chloride channel protein [Pseudomonadales bacterium]
MTLPSTRTKSPLKLPRLLSPEFFRRQLANVDALPQLSILAIVAGLLTGLVILAFRVSIDFVLAEWILQNGGESFESLPYIGRLLLPVAGALLIGILLTRFTAADRRVGVVHVMERLSRHQGHLPARNAIIQFFGGLIALISGQSGGREGPAVHLGAASSSMIGQALNLPNNSIRTLVACGTAAAIAGSFNTPIAGVIFAMEVVMMEYTMGSFIPVIIASVTATLLTHFFIGNEPAFIVASVNLQSWLEIPFIVVGGVIIGCIAAAFITAVQMFARLSDWPFWLRALFAGAITGLAGVTAPEVMGIGYDTVNSAMLGQLTLTTLLLVVLLKTLASAAAVGLGLPVGTIGPTFVIGAAVGGVLGFIGSTFTPIQEISVGFYVMLGMAAMMGAVLQAPLAALLAVMELTANPNLILPAMLIIVVATLVTGVAFKQKSVFISTLKTLGLQYPADPVTLHLQRAGVTAIMNRALVRLSQQSSIADVRQALAQKPRWIVIEKSAGRIRCVLSATDLLVYVNEEFPLEGEPEDETEERMIDLMKIPGQRLDVANIDYRATLAEAQHALKESEAICVRRVTAPMIASVLGVITQQDIDNYRDADL